MKRDFKIGERVYIPELTYESVLPLENGTATPFYVKRIAKNTFSDKTTLVDVVYERNGEKAIIQVKAKDIYKVAVGRTCRRCGGDVCVEHDESIDYPFYCPECDENMFGIETDY